MNRKGFTLIELLVVIGIIGLIGALATLTTGQARAKARDEKRVSDLAAIQQALFLGHGTNGVYPNLVNTAIGTGSNLVLCGKGLTVVFVANSLPANCDSDKLYMAAVPTGTNPYIFNTSNPAANFTICTTLEVGDVKLKLTAGPVNVNESSSIKNVASCP